MKYAFDIDGTLTIRAIATLANDLYAAGHIINIITGGLKKQGEDDEFERRKDHRYKQLEDLGVKFHRLYICVGINTAEVAAQKAKLCRDLDIGLIFEDSDLYIRAIRNAAPKTTVIDVSG
jgi:hypothetical protein